MAESARRVDSTDEFLAAFPVGSKTVYWVVPHVDEHHGGDLVSKPFFVDNSVFIANGAVRDFLHFFGFQRPGRVGNIIAPTRVLHQVLVIVPGADINMKQ